MHSTDVLADAFNRVSGLVHEVVDGIPADALTHRIDPEANTIAWLVWHLARVQDDHVADVAGTAQVWTSQGWVERFRLPYDVGETGYAMAATDVAAVDVPADLLAGYHDAVHATTLAYVASLSDADLDRIVDERWDPPVTLGARLVSVIGDTMQHAGQAAYVRGVLGRRG